MKINQDQINDLKQIVKKGNLIQNEPLKIHTTIKIGGIASVFIETDEESKIVAIYQYCETNSISLYILGGGSNVVFADRPYFGVVLKLKAHNYKITKTKENNLLTFPAGYNTHLATQKALEHSLSGIEGLHGLPGTIGGAVYMNSKWPKDKYQISDSIAMVRYLTKDFKIINLSKSDLKFTYGYSSFQNMKGIILAVTFSLKLNKKTSIQNKHQKIITYRKQTQPFGVSTAGCVFKNLSKEQANKMSLPTASVGYLIDKCGLKNYQVGKLIISPLHANFIINTGGGTFADYEKLVNLIRTKIKAKFALQLEEEVKILN